MIQHTLPTWQDLSWQDALKSLITCSDALIEQLKLPTALRADARNAAKLFPLRVTQHFVDRMEPGNPKDPLLLQVLPLYAELESPPEFNDDPLEEARFTPTTGLVHKYTKRVLIITATTCAINCRYCFRREFDYKQHRLSKSDWAAIFDYILDRREIDEVIFSGGDPLLHSDEHFAWLLEQLAFIPHLERVRLHSRLPIVLPSRLTDALLVAFGSSRLQATLVVHSNHANEIDDEVGLSLSKVRNAGITVLNQAVLLKGINDSAVAQTQLAKRLFEFQVLPYYLHMLDRVSGSAHYEVSEASAYQVYNDMRQQLPGYLLPKLVREEAGECAKTVISPSINTRLPQ